MSSGASLSQARAKALVEKIAEDHGYLDEDFLSELTPKARKRVENAMLKKDGLIGSSVVTVAKNLYTSNARFIFELLQNADDNHYSEAFERDEMPYITFKITPRYMFVECNEDGFTPENLMAICNIGESSKSGAQGYIGEKGIGFKSVFMAAYKVHIQSRNFSFSFQHRPGESGMGMISPVWEDAVDTPLAGVTRMKLFLRDDGDEATLTTRRQTILQQLQELQDTYFLFLKNIRRINVVSLDQAGETLSSARLSIQRPPSVSNLVSLITVRDGSSEQVTKYHLTRHLARDLPKNQNRTYSETDERTQAWSSSEIVLAFPLSADGSAPVIKSQQIFAYLPMRNMGFKFLIQADFETQGSREDIVIDSDRNMALRDQIADAFAEAAKQLCANDFLQFTWMRYLPQKDDFPWEGYWKTLVDRIKAKLEDVPLLRPLSGGIHRPIGQMRRVQAQITVDGMPIFDDIRPEKYLSKDYSWVDLVMLNEYGLHNVWMGEVLDRASADLSRPTSRMKSTETSERWHTAAAEILSLPFEQNWDLEMKRVRNLDLIPLQDGKWASAESLTNPLSFPTVNDTEIPRDLPLSLINSRAALNAARKKLCKHLGATHTSVNRVRELIFDKYPSVVNLRFLFGFSAHPEEISLAHLTFLYRTHDKQSPETAKYRHIAVLTEDGSLKNPRSQDIYIIDDDRCGARNLLKSALFHHSKAPPGFPVPFLLPRYLDGPNGQRDDETAASWLPWLQSILGIRTRLRLIQEDTPTDLFRYVMTHRSAELVGVLHKYWGDIGPAVIRNKSIQDEIGRAMVLCCGWKLNRLSETYLPSPELKASCSQYLADVNRLPFLDLDATPAPTDLNSWDFLHTAFRVSKSDDLTLYLNILESIASETKDGEVEDASIPPKVYELYRKIHARTIDSDDKREAQKLVRSKFEDKVCLLLPTPEKAVWKQPNGISSELHLIEGDQTLRLRKSQTDLHIEESDDSLKIYVHRNTYRRDYCFSFKLPRALLYWIMVKDTHTVPTTQDERAKGLISSVFATDPSSLEYLLEEEGITELEFREEIVHNENPATPTRVVNNVEAMGSETSISTVFSEASSSDQWPTPGTEYSTQHSRTESSTSDVFVQSAESVISVAGMRQLPATAHQRSTVSRPITPSRSVAPSEPTIVQTPEDIGPASGSIYVGLLEMVVQVARQAEFPHRGSFDMSALRDALPQLDRYTDIPDEYFRMRSTSQIERDKMIGAAGELYVFELLSHLNPALPDFSRALWQSTIRKYVTVHPDYNDMLPWNGRETADIRYKDSSSILTEAFIQNGYLDETVWNGRKPTYYIEVKTTTGPCETPFFMSKNQYKRIGDMTNGTSGNQSPDTIYVVFRVFNLGRESMGLAIYVDPYLMKQQGSLKFMAETWSVVPGRRTP